MNIQSVMNIKLITLNHFYKQAKEFKIFLEKRNRSIINITYAKKVIEI